MAEGGATIGICSEFEVTLRTSFPESPGQTARISRARAKGDSATAYHCLMPHARAGAPGDLSCRSVLSGIRVS